MRAIISPRASDTLLGNAKGENVCWTYTMAKCKSIGIKSLMDNNSVIDSGYRGEWFVPITNCNDIPIVIIKDVEKAEELFPFSKKIVYPYSKGIAQFVMLPVPKFEEVEITLEDLQNIKSERGAGKLGSSDK